MLPTAAPALPALSGDVVTVSTTAQLLSAVANIVSGRTIVLNNGTYTISDAAGGSLYFNSALTNIALRGASTDYTAVVLQGSGMSTLTSNSNFGIWLGGGVSGMLIANLSIRDVYYSPIQMNAGASGIRVYHCRLLDAGQQFIKSTQGGGNDNCTVEYCGISYTTFSRTLADPYNGYTNGVDVKGANWIVRDNLFRNILSNGALAGQAVLCWQGATNATIERNTFINCAREIGMGLQVQAGFTDNSGGIVRNNFLWRSAGLANTDVSIQIADSPNTKVYNNTVRINGNYANAIEYRFATTTGASIRNNLTDGPITARDGASATVSNNVTSAPNALFVDPAAGDLHLLSSAASAINVGTSLVADVPDDFDGYLRPIGSAFDVGGDEFGTTTVIIPVIVTRSGVASNSALFTLTNATSPLSLPLVQSTDAIFTFVGTFTLPATIQQDDGVGSNLAISEDGTVMYFNSYFDSVAKTTIPASGTGSASLLIGWTATPGSGGQNQGNGALLEVGGSVYKTKYSIYTDVAQTAWIQKGTTSLTGWTGLSSTSGQNMRLLAQGFFRIPTLWQSLLGGTVATLGNRLSIITNAQCGYGFAVFDPATVGAGNVPITPLLNYPYSNALEPVDSSAPGWAGYPKNATGGTDLVSSTNAYMASCLIVPGSRSLLYITAHGYGVADNGCRPGSSVHNDPNRVQVVAYDLRDLVDVKNGVTQAYQPRPYAWWVWNYGGVHWNACVGGAPLAGGWGGYDPIKGRWYMCADLFGNPMYTWTVNSL